MRQCMQPHQLLHLPILRRTRVALRSPDKQLMTTDLKCFRRDATRLRCFLPATHIINIAQRCLQDQIKGNDIRELTVDDEVWFWPNRVATVGSKAAMAEPWWGVCFFELQRFQPRPAASGLQFGAPFRRVSCHLRLSSRVTMIVCH